MIGCAATSAPLASVFRRPTLISTAMSLFHSLGHIVRWNRSRRCRSRPRDAVDHMQPPSRTPEGSPHQCPLCGKIADLEPCYPAAIARPNASPLEFATAQRGMHVRQPWLPTPPWPHSSISIRFDAPWSWRDIDYCSHEVATFSGRRAMSSSTSAAGKWKAKRRAGSRFPAVPVAMRFRLRPVPQNLNSRPKLMPWAQKSLRVKEKPGEGGPVNVLGKPLKVAFWVVLALWSRVVPGRATSFRYRKL